MAKATPKNGKKVSPAPIENSAGLQDLMRAILAMSQSSQETEPFAHAAGGENVVIDTDVDGDRYVLIRMPAVERRSPPLSPRELEIVRMVAQGHPNKIIAVVLNISSWTVCTHLRRIFAKLGVSSRAAMVARLAEFGAPEPALAAEPPLLRPPAAAMRVAAQAAPAAAPLRRERHLPAARGRAPAGRAWVKLRLPAEAG
jgi:DNA-binding CsgD family transcriptional regulator